MAFRNEAFSFFTHAAGALAAVGGLALLLARADAPTAVLAFAVYGATMVAMFATSALHHVAHAEDGFFRRLDMSAIYLFIAGTYTPFCLLVVPPRWGIPLLALVWTFALAGIVARWTLPRTPRWATATIYLSMGWIGIAGLPAIVEGLGWRTASLVLLGGAFYTVGAVVYAQGRPDPWPRYVGHHGLWHVFVLGASATHFVAILAIQG